MLSNNIPECAKSFPARNQYTNCSMWYVCSSFDKVLNGIDGILKYKIQLDDLNGQGEI